MGLVPRKPNPAPLSVSAPRFFSKSFQKNQRLEAPETEAPAPVTAPARMTPKATMKTKKTKAARDPRD